MARVHLTKKQVLIAIGIVGLIVLMAGAGALVFWLQNKDSLPSSPTSDQSLQAPGQAAVSTDVVDAQNLALQGKTDEANKKIEDALNKPGTSDEDKYDLYIQRGVVYTNSNQPQKALDEFRLAEKIRLDFTVAHLIAEQLEILGDKAGAIDYFKKAIALLDKKSPLYNADKEIYEKKVIELGGTL